MIRKNTSQPAKLRLKKSLSQKELAKQANISALHLLRVERASERPSEELVARVAGILGVSQESYWQAWKSARKAFIADLKHTG